MPGLDPAGDWSGGDDHRSCPPSNTIIYAVGDIHGRLDLLDGVIAELRRAVAEAGTTGDRVTAVFLGDYIDRGPDSRGVVSRLIDLSDEGLCETVFLRGNHEQILLDVIEADADPMMWLQYGGEETLRAYGVDKPVSLAAKGARAVADRMREALPPGHLAFLQATRTFDDRGDYFFVHAGLRSDRLLPEQTEADMLWQRVFDDRRPVHGKVVVHGHTPREQPVAGRWRIGIDTEAYASGALTALRLQGAERQFLKFQTADDGAGSPVSLWESTLEPHRAQAGGGDGNARRSRAATSGSQADRAVFFTRLSIVVVVLAMIAVLAWLYFN